MSSQRTASRLLLALAWAMLACRRERAAPLPIKPTTERPALRARFVLAGDFAGRSAQEVETTVATPAERELTALAGVERVTSSSREGGIQMLVGTSSNDPNLASSIQKLTTRHHLTIVSAGARGITTEITLSGSRYSFTDLRGAADMFATALARDGHVLGATVCGLRSSVLVEVDPTRTTAYAVALSNLVDALGAMHASDLHAIEKLELPNAAKGVPVRVRDIADVSTAAMPGGCRLLTHEARVTVVTDAALPREDVRKLAAEVLPPGISIAPWEDRASRLLLHRFSPEGTDEDTMLVETDRLGKAVSELEHVEHISTQTSPTLDLGPSTTAHQMLELTVGAGTTWPALSRDVRAQFPGWNLWLLGEGEARPTVDREATVYLIADDRGPLLEPARAIQRALSALPNVVGSTLVGVDDIPTWEVTLDPTKAAAAGVTQRDLDLATAFRSPIGYVGGALAGPPPLPIRVRWRRQGPRGEAPDLASLVVGSHTGSLASVATIRATPKPATLLRREGRRAVAVRFAVKSDVDLQQAFDAARDVKRPAGCLLEVE